jgi:N-formylglutamate amidohydrolase
MGDLRGGRERVQNTMDKIFKHIGLPPHDLDDVEAKNTRPYEPMSEAVRNRLETFYAPYNERLKQLIGAEQLDW